MTDLRALFLGLAFALAAWAGVAHAQSGDVRRERAEAIIAALSTGDPAAFEAAAAAHYDPALLARRTPDDRAQLTRQIHGDFGQMEIERLMINDEGLRAGVQGSGGSQGTFVFQFGPAPDYRITRLQIELGAGGHGDQPAQAPLTAPVNGAMSAAEMRAALDGWLNPMVERDEFAGVVLVARDGRPFVTRTYGPRQRDPNVAADENTSYNIASIGKKITQTALARLIQEGRITRNTTIGEIIPDYPQVETRAATIDQLVNMRGGVTDFFGAEFEAADKTLFASNHDYYSFVSSRPARFAPGARTEYCNGCYIVLGEIIERVSGMRFEDYVQRNVFDPARMRRSGYFNRSNLPANTAISYSRNNDGGALADNTASFGLTGSGAGGLYSNARDLLAFDNALREGRLLDTEMTAWVLGGDAREGDRNVNPLGVAGGAPGTNAVFDSDGRWTVIVTANLDPPIAERVGPAISSALRR